MEAILEKVELVAFKNRNINSLSGGEQQRAVLAQALAQEAEILLLDEPAQHLDPKAKNWLYDMLKSLAYEGKTILCATHDLEQLSNPDIRILGIKNGKLVYDTQDSADLLMEANEIFRKVF